MFWVKLAKSGENMPLDYAPVLDGNFVLVDPRTAVMVGNEEVPIGCSRYRSHFASCPDAKGWRRKRAIPDPPVRRQ